MQAVKPRTRYIHPGQVVVWSGSAPYRTFRGWLFYSDTLDKALSAYFQHVARHGHAEQTLVESPCLPC